MTIINWGLLGPEQLVSERRTRTLGVGVAVRAFNDLAVPSLGGVRFTKGVFLACLGVNVAERVRAEGLQVSNIQVTNAIEALACCLSYENNNWTADKRLLGRTKLQGKNDLSYKAVSSNNFYVTQPMRMATVQTLPGLGLVDAQGERFNSYSLSEDGLNFVKVACHDLKCHRLGIVNYLVRWVKGENSHSNSNPNQYGLQQALSPLVCLSKDAKSILKQRLVSGNDDDANRRRNALQWVSNIEGNPCINWSQPSELTAQHFSDIKSGAYFFMLRDCVMSLLDVIETEVANARSATLDLRESLPKKLTIALSNVKAAADKFISLDYDPSPEQIASVFANECLENSAAAIIVNMVERDNLVLKVRDKFIVKGAAFGGVQSEPTELTADEQLFPQGVSYRIWNLYTLNLDFNDQLDAWLNDQGESDE